MELLPYKHYSILGYGSLDVFVVLGLLPVLRGNIITSRESH